MAEKVEDLTIAYEEEGQVLVQEIDKEVLSSGAWATVIFRYRELDRARGEYGPDKYSVRRGRTLLKSPAAKAAICAAKFKGKRCAGCTQRPARA